MIMVHADKRTAEISMWDEALWFMQIYGQWREKGRKKEEVNFFWEFCTPTHFLIYFSVIIILLLLISSY